MASHFTITLEHTKQMHIENNCNLVHSTFLRERIKSYRDKKRVYFKKCIKFHRNPKSVIFFNKN